MKIKYKGPTLDPSGYGCSCRDFIYALHHAGVEIVTESWDFEQEKGEFYGRTGLLVEELKRRKSNYDIVINHYVPNYVERRYEVGKLNVGYSTWETDKLPSHWVTQINKFFDLQLVPSEYNKRIYEDCGITIPVEVMPHCFDTKAFKDAMPLKSFTEDKRFKFLSVFQWHERKNPVGLLKAYYSEFNGHNDVLLIIKSYGLERSENEKEHLRQTIQQVKKEMRLEMSAPPVLFIGDLLTRDQLLSLYKSCDCFVLPTRSEGFGMPFAEACAAGKTVVAPNYGGQIDFLEFPFAELIDYQLTPVAHMPMPNYDGTMCWCDPNLIEFREAMGMFYSTDKETLAEWGKEAQQMVDQKLSYKTVGQQYKKILENLL